jgi:2,4-dienoyl-CoA reductase-like NADH-dependent reductase (Old Yellow Enzyme family)
MAYSHLLAPGRIGRLEARNRIVMAPMGSNLCEPDGTPGERMLRYYEARARGGAGLVIVEVAAIAWPAGAANPNQLAVSDDANVGHLARLVDVIHAHGARAAIQLQHAGKVATRDIAAGRPMWVPSIPPQGPNDLFADLTAEDRHTALRDYFQPGAATEYHVMTHDDIVQLRKWFVDAVVRAQAAGFDGVELHAGHGYVIDEFLSPHSNGREDEYGGAVSSRARLLLEVVRDVRAAVGYDMALWCRLNGEEIDVADGETLDDACRTAVLAREAGLDAIHVSAYADPGSGVAFTNAPLVHQPGGFVEYARAVKRATGAPVIAVGRITPDAGDRLIGAGDADFVAMGRALLADPTLPQRLIDDSAADARPCIYSYRCVGNIFLTKGARCTANPSTGREHELPVALEPAAVARRVVVIGGGPAGMEAARIAAARGHEVTLLERAAVLGGQARLAAMCEPAIGDLLAWFARQLDRLGVDVRLGVDATASLVDDLAPDAVITATGSTVPFDADRLATLFASASVADTITVFGGNAPAALAAATIAGRGARVSLRSPHDNFGVGLSPPRLWRTMAALRALDVELITNAAEPTDDRALRFEPWVPPSTSVVNGERIGDCREPGFIDGAMLDAAKVARAL